jgi:hypothetical protein
MSSRRLARLILRRWYLVARYCNARHDATDLEVRQVADLDDEELLQAAGVVRAIRALPSWSGRGYPGGTGFRMVLSGYALDLADEIDKRGREKLVSDSCEDPGSPLGYRRPHTRPGPG